MGAGCPVTLSAYAAVIAVVVGVLSRYNPLLLIIATLLLATVLAVGMTRLARVGR